MVSAEKFTYGFAILNFCNFCGTMTYGISTSPTQVAIYYVLFNLYVN